MKRFWIAIALVTLGVLAFWSFRVRAASEAAQFVPIPTRHTILLPGKTEIPALIPNGISSSSAAGSSITAVVSAPVLFGGNVAIPRGAKLDGQMDKISARGKTAKAEISFNVLTLGDRSWPMQTVPIVVTLPIRTDAEILGDAVKTLLAAGVSAGIGASSKDERLLRDTLVGGVRTSLPVKSAVPITVTLLHDLQI
jgi:spore maturation protein SpmA